MGNPRIAAIDAFPLRLPYLTEFKISRGSVGGPAAGAPHVYVRVTADTGDLGWGESRPSPRWSYETQESVVTTINNYLAPVLVGMDASDIEAVHAAMEREIAPGITVGQPVAKSGIDMALHDLNAKWVGVPLHSFLKQGAASRVRLSYLASVDSPGMAEKVTGEARAAGYEGFKVKIGIHPSLDVDILRAVKSAAGGAYLWADANQAYTVEDAVELSRKMAEIGVDVLEQPVAANDFLGLAELVDRSAVPIAVDESVFSVGDLEQLIRLKALDALVVKVSKMAGLTGASRCVERALDAGKWLLGSGLTETRLGLAASAHLYAAYGVEIPVDLNGPQFLADDPVVGGVSLDGAVVCLADTSGIGVEIDEARLQEFAAVMGN
ncbi:MAG: mandelate racemase [Armatimonadetes bacterium]|nr:mandelate racemase [Armatimonadota bacterium]